ncbi:homeobox-leucine zipper protein ROC6-like [Phragmites australis]|uniref:homeobox-leucine zipper protein ROC6-like n=1 Tax=Phragmites australis TaxID=29695 RepID=UPI002D77DF01|nr:homeobox-leucine zipper protein ROC6-like [Phragmites australis]
MNAELWVQLPRMPNRRVKFMRFTKPMANSQQWAVVDVSIDGMLGEGQEGSIVPPAGQTGCRLLPSGCLIEDMGNGYCKVTWIVHAEYDETTVPPLFRPLLRSGQALGARRWLAPLQRQCEYMAVLRSFPTTDGRRGIMELAQRMTASFHAAISGPVTLASSNVFEWRGGSGTGSERFEVAVRMVTWCASSVPDGQLPGMVLSAATTVWLPSTLPQHVFDYLRDWRHHGEWGTHTHGATVKELAYISTGGYLEGNAVSVLRPNVTDGTNSNILILQDVSTDVSCSLVVYSPIEENAMLAVMNGGDHTSSFLLPSGFAVLPDGHGLAHHSPSTSSAFATAGSLVTVACQTLLPGITTDNLATEAFDDAGKQLCHAIGKIRAAVEADIIVPA